MKPELSTSTTIAALATAPAPAGLAVIRVSGPQTKTALRSLFKSKKPPSDYPREMILGDLIDYRTGSQIDKALAVFMPGPNSFTGEDVGEFQFHGSPLLVQKMLRSLFAFGAIPAEPGEFTKRAFMNGKLDLVQAEAIADLISATSEQALSVAGDHLKGRFSSAIKLVGDPLRDVLAEIEASIDFSDEDIQPLATNALIESTLKAKDSVSNLLATYSCGQVVKEGFKVLLCGRPNAGKSSLLNLVLGRERAIVSSVAGTTRDLIEESAIIGGYRFVFCDSAGLTDSTDVVEKMGVELAKERIPWADLVLFVVDASDTSEEWQQVLSYLRGNAKKIWLVTNKIDLNPNAFGTFFCDSTICAQNFYLSARTRDGLQSLMEALAGELRGHLGDSSAASHLVTNERQRNCLLRAEESLRRTVEALQGEVPIEIASAEIRIALSALSEIVGETYTEDILGRIFSKFCVGK